MNRRWLFAIAGVAIVALALVGGQMLLNRTSGSASSEQAGTSSTPAPDAYKGALVVTTGALPVRVAPLPQGTPAATAERTSPASEGSRLRRLASSPARLISGFSADKATPGETYDIVFKPWGYGPQSRLGQTVAATVTSLTARTTPSIALSNSTVLLVMDANRGGQVVSGGTYAGVITLVSLDGTLVPVLTATRVTNP
ncbi:MAG: hypothetical protein HGB10_11925 [Coriobacteriia bacterium]|nr:hypothetical protein [Coriobacteriia bacterium]